VQNQTITTDIAIVGARPSGLAAADMLKKSGMSITVIDEQARPGGQILRQPPKQFNIANWLKGQNYRHVKKLVTSTEDASFINWRMRTTVLGIFNDPDNPGRCQLWLECQGRLSWLSAQTIILAQGCGERPAHKIIERRHGRGNHLVPL